MFTKLKHPAFWTCTQHRSSSEIRFCCNNVMFVMRLCLLLSIKAHLGGVFRNTDNRYKQNEMHWRNCWNTGTCKSSVHLILTYYISMFWTNRERLYSHVHVVCRHFHSVIRKQNNAFLMFCSISHHIWTKQQWKVITDSNYQHNSSRVLKWVSDSPEPCYLFSRWQK